MYLKPTSKSETMAQPACSAMREIIRVVTSVLMRMPRRCGPSAQVIQAQVVSQHGSDLVAVEVMPAALSVLSEDADAVGVRIGGEHHVSAELFCGGQGWTRGFRHFGIRH